MPHLDKEMALFRQGYCFIAGVDEAGRGAWAGPVVASAVILPLEQANLTEQLTGLDDSKKLTAIRRAEMFSQIQQVALAIGIGYQQAPEIDTHNILQATRLAMVQAIQQLTPPPDYLLLDYVRLATTNLPQQAFAKADSISLSVAAASIIAKVTRDQLMITLAEQYPAYGFERHKGYGTAYHRQALAKHGPLPIHRMSFKPLHRFAPKLI